eukprot:3269702-Rhodomonas_salina.2
MRFLVFDFGVYARCQSPGHSAVVEPSNVSAGQGLLPSQSRAAICSRGPVADCQFGACASTDSPPEFLLLIESRTWMMAKRSALAACASVEASAV